MVFTGWEETCELQNWNFTHCSCLFDVKAYNNQQQSMRTRDVTAGSGKRPPRNICGRTCVYTHTFTHVRVHMYVVQTWSYLWTFFECSLITQVHSTPRQNSLPCWLFTTGDHFKKIFKKIFDIWHSEDCASRYILIIKANEVHHFSTLFW